MSGAKALARSSLWLALLVHPSLASARSALDTTGHLKLFSLGTFPAPYENEVPGALLGASGSSVADGRLKLVWRPRRALRLELHPTLTMTQGQASLGLDTGVARRADELLPLSYDWVDDPQLSLRARLDRASLRWDIHRLRLTLGRQPVTFGKGRVFTPLDLVAPFAPTTIDNSYKAGVDALRLDWFEGMSGRITLLGAYLAQAGERFDAFAWRDAAFVAHGKGSVGDALEVEGFAGWLFDEPVLGVSMFYDGGSIGTYGDLNWTHTDAGAFVRSVLGAQYKPTAKTFINIELYVQTLGASAPDDYLTQLAGERYQRGELVQLGRLYGAILGSYQLAPLWTLGGAVLVNAEDPSVMAMPSLTWSAGDQATLSLGALAGLGRRPTLSLPTAGPAQLALGSEYGSVPLIVYVQGAFFF